MIIKYTTFPDSESFEKFQEENNVTICQVAPLFGMDISQTTNKSNVYENTKANVSIGRCGVFVTYINK